MEIKEAITERRSVRKFKDTPVSEETIRQIVNLARFSPSWKNSQTVRYVAVYDPECKQRIAQDGVMQFEFNQKTIGRAPLLVLVTTVDGQSGYEKDGQPSTSKGSHWQSFDAGISAQTFCLAAHSVGVGTVILGIYDEKKVKEIAEIPEGQSVSALIAVGYPLDPEKKPAPPRKDVDDLLTIK